MVCDGPLLVSEPLCIAGTPIAADPREFADMFRESYVDTLYFDALVSDSQGDAMGSCALQSFILSSRPLSFRFDLIPTLLNTLASLMDRH